MCIRDRHRRYNNVKGAEQLFDIFADVQSGQIAPPAILSTHPESKDRWRRLKSRAQSNGWQTDASTMPLDWSFE